MTLSGHLTKLQAVNEMLRSIGEDPVNSLSSGLDDAEIAEALLDIESRRIQALGWHVNTRWDVELAVDANDHFLLPTNTLRVDTTNPRPKKRFVSFPTSSGWVDAKMVRSADDTKWILYDQDNDTESWTTETTLNVAIIQLQEFANLTPLLQYYIFTSAAHKYQKQVMGSQVLYQFTREDVEEAMVAAVNEDSENEGINMLRSNPHVFATVYRNNPSAFQ